MGLGVGRGDFCVGLFNTCALKELSLLRGESQGERI
jgi:hypothetical protein